MLNALNISRWPRITPTPNSTMASNTVRAVMVQFRFVISISPPCCRRVAICVVYLGLWEWLHIWLMSNSTSHVSHGDLSIAYHIKWGFRKESLIWVGDIPIGVNFHPLATEFRGWLIQKGVFSVFA